MPLDPTVQFPGAVATIPEPGPTTFEDDDGYEHDLLLTKIAREIVAAQTAIGPAPAVGSVQTPADNTARRGRASGKGSWDHPQGYWMANKSGATRAAGDVVIQDTANNDAFTTTTTAAHPDVLGVVEIGGANNASCAVIMGGRVAQVAVTAATRGQYLETSTTAGKAVGNASRSAGTFGRALADASGGFVVAYLYPSFNRLPVAGTLTSAHLSAAAGIYAAQTDASVARQNLIPNGGMEDWTGLTSTSTSGVLLLSGWTTLIAAGTATLARESATANVATGSKHSLSIATGVGAVAYATHTFPNVEEIRGRIITVGADVKASTTSASILLRYTNGGVDTDIRGTHSGSGSFSRLTATQTIPSTATAVTLFMCLEAGSQTAYFDNVSANIGSSDNGYLPMPLGLLNAGSGLTRGWTAFTPTVTQGGSVSVTVNRARYLIVGKTALVQLQLTSTAAGTGGNVVQVNLPTELTAAYASSIVCGAANYGDLGTAGYGLNAFFATTTGIRFQGYNQIDAFGVAPAVTIAIGDVISADLMYELA